MKFLESFYEKSFKPYYKWITFNIKETKKEFYLLDKVVLNLIINGLPSI